MWIVKLGGSLAEDPVLRFWLEQLSLYGAGRVVIVPGGGPFADDVRAAQQLWGFDDLTAHRMALLAMDQYGLMLAGLCPGYALVRREESLQEALKASAIPIWLPSTSLWECDELPASWSVTSDSIAAWLARRLSAERLILVKPWDRPALSVDAAQLKELGVVDAAFPEFARGACFETTVVGKHCYDSLHGQLFSSARGAAVAPLFKPPE